MKKVPAHAPEIRLGRVTYTRARIYLEMSCVSFTLGRILFNIVHADGEVDKLDSGSGMASSLRSANTKY